MKLKQLSLGLGVLAAFCQVAGATTVLLVDFENAVNPGFSVPVPAGEPITQAGWNRMSVANAPSTTVSSINDTFGGIGIFLTAGGGGIFQGRTDGAWNNMSGTSWNNMVEDMIAGRSGNGTVSILLTGLDDSLDHTLTVWHNVSASNGMSFAAGLYAITPSVNVGTLLGSPTSGQATNWHRDLVPLADDDDFLNSVISFNSTGGNAEIILTSASANFFVPMSGLQLDSVPEPSGVALLGLGGLALMLRRRR